MKPYQLLELIAQGESQVLDFKKTITHGRKIAKTLVAFANSKGGQILVGVMDNQEVIGIDPEEEIFSLQEASRHYCQPEVPLSFTIVEDADGLLVLVVDIEESPEKPHYALTRTDEWNVYLRMNDKSILAGETSIKKMQKGASGSRPPKGDKHTEKLWQYLELHEQVTVKTFALLANISQRRARRILTDLTLQGHLLTHDLEKETCYFKG